MKILKINTWVLFFLWVGLSPSLFAQSFAFESVEREEGTAFFALDESTGQVYYMLDHFSEAGVWKNYGGLIPVYGKNNFAFYVHWREEGTAFFALNTNTGQLYFMLDYGEDAGNWRDYGGTITKSTNAQFSFQASSREFGTAFFAMDESTGQVYYMLDHGEAAGMWKSYGEIISK